MSRIENMTMKTTILITSLTTFVLRADLPAQDRPTSPSVRLRSEVLMGMKLESVTEDGNETCVITTGSQFVLGKDGTIRCYQRIPQQREVARMSLPPETAPLKLEKRNDFACLFITQGVSLTLQGDSLVIVRAEEDVEPEVVKT